MDIFTRCKKAEVFDEARGRKLAAAVTRGPFNNLVVTLPQDFKPDPDIPVRIAFLDSVQGVIICNCSLTSPMLSEDRKFRTYRCHILERLSQTQRREDIKIALSIQTMVTLSGTEKRAPATLRDISAGGVYLYTTLPAQKGKRLLFDFLEAGKPIPLIAEILRVERQMDRYNQPVIGYGCRFVHLSPQREAQLRSYIFKVDRRLAKP